MLANGLLADTKARCNRLAGQSIRDQGQHIALSLRETVGHDDYLYRFIDGADAGRPGLGCGFNPSVQRIDESAQPVYRSLVSFEDAH
ncbi:hypothetical protein [Burkholderia ubonensis]|uniref:hypothetical protein n=1 Tax=Burkholderia ubonensis TaxID=101571 RepID=UPI000AF94A71|nr:hypothetical protein [Burkholderia ubonensis]